MAYNTKSIITDKDGNPISQYYNRDLDQYEAVEGFMGANKVIVYKSDGSENTDISLLPILEKLEQLTGTVIGEETRKSNELQRIALYNQIFQMLNDGELKGDTGEKGDKGDPGPGLEFDWQGTMLGVRVQRDAEYVYVDLQGPPGSIENLDKTHVETALGYTPANELDLDNKVDKVAGKQLSDVNYTIDEKMKLEGIEDGAQKNTVTSVAGKTGEITLINSDVGLSNVSDDAQVKKVGDTMQGILVAQSNTSYTVRQVRNIILSPNNADINAMQDGEIWIKYK